MSQALSLHIFFSVNSAQGNNNVSLCDLVNLPNSGGREENQLDATACFIALIIYSTCFGHSYDHQKELENILVLLPNVVCDALVAGGRLLGGKQQAMGPG